MGAGAGVADVGIRVYDTGMSSLPTIPYVTEEEFLALPESSERIELIDGEIILSPSPSLNHQIAVGRLFRALSAWADHRPPAAVCISPLDVRIAPDRVLQPDVFLLLGGLPEDTSKVLSCVPDLVVEVMSQRRTYDRMTKRLVYAEAGVTEYWIVDPYGRDVEVVRGLETVSREREILRSPLLPGLEIEVPALFL